VCVVCTRCSDVLYAASCYRCSMVSLCVTVLGTTVISAKTTEPVKMPFGEETRGPKDWCIR